MHFTCFLKKPDAFSDYITIKFTYQSKCNLLACNRISRNQKQQIGLLACPTHSRPHFSQLRLWANCYNIPQYIFLLFLTFRRSQIISGRYLITIYFNFKYLQKNFWMLSFHLSSIYYTAIGRELKVKSTYIYCNIANVQKLRYFSQPYDDRYKECR